MKQFSLLLTLFFFVLGATYAQRTISGTVTDAAGEALIGSSVVVKGTTVGTATDNDGKYQLRVPEGSNVLEFSYTGYETQEITLGASNVVNATLAEGVVLTDVVVTALGVEREEKAIGYAVQDVGSEEIGATKATGFIDALSGKAAGVYVNRSSGAAGASSRIILRGQTSFNGDNEALIVVDGVRLSNEENNSERGLYGVANSNRGLDINPNDIESVTVLKGGAATALYGVEGARGVVLITTKKGSKDGKLTVELSSNLTISEVSNLPEFQRTYSQGSGGNWYGPDGNDGIWWGGFSRALSWGARVDTLAYDGSDYQYDKNGRIVSQNDPTAQGPVNDYKNVEDFFQTGTTWTNNVSISGGDGKTDYRLSFGLTDEEGIVPLNTYNRINFGVNVGTRIMNDKMTLGASVNYARTNGRRIQQGSNTSGVTLGLYRTPITFDNSNGSSDPVNDESSYIFLDGSQRNYRGGGGYDNPYWVVNNSPFVDQVNRMFGNIKAAYEFDQWFTLSTTLGTDFYTDNRQQQFELGSRTFPAGQVFEDQYNYRHTDIYINILGNGDLSDDISLNYNLGTNLWNQTQKQNYTQGDGLNFVGFPAISNTQSVQTTVDHNPERNFSLFASIDVGFQNFLYVTLTGRNDWLGSLIAPSKTFNSGDISVFYPSASMSLVFSELMGESDVLSFGKARFSYAEVGGGAPNAYATSTVYNLPNNSTTIYSLNDGWTNGVYFPLDGTPGFTYAPLLGNADLIPSTTKDLELGLDLRFLKDRLSLDGTFYTRNSVDQIIAINIANSTGFQRRFVNSGELKTVGGEVVLGIVPVATKDFTWELNLNFSKWKTTVESLPEGVPNQYLDGFTGTSIYNIAPDEENDIVYEYGQLFGGAFQHANSADGKSFDPELPYNPDGALIIDDSGSPDPNSDDFNPNYGYPLVDPNLQVIGNPNPDFLLGISSTLNYKGIGLSFLFDIKQGGDIWNGTNGALTFFGRTTLTEDRVPVIWNDNQGFVHDYANANSTFEGVLASDGSTANIAVPLDENWYTGNGGGFGSVAEHFVEDGSYMRLRYVTLSYNFGDILDVKGLSDLTLSVSGRNLLLITDYTGPDPELSLVGSSSNGQGLDYFQLPNTRSYTVGLSARF